MTEPTAPTYPTHVYTDPDALVDFLFDLRDVRPTLRVDFLPRLRPDSAPTALVSLDPGDLRAVFPGDTLTLFPGEFFTDDSGERVVTVQPSVGVTR